MPSNPMAPLKMTNNKEILEMAPRPVIFCPHMIQMQLADSSTASFSICRVEPHDFVITGGEYHDRAVGHQGDVAAGGLAWRALCRYQLACQRPDRTAVRTYAVDSVSVVSSPISRSPSRNIIPHTAEPLQDWAQPGP